jgi:ribosomal protein S24E
MVNHIPVLFDGNSLPSEQELIEKILKIICAKISTVVLRGRKRELANNSAMIAST